MKLVFKTSNVAKPDATFLHCTDSTINATNGYYRSGKFYLDSELTDEVTCTENNRYFDLKSGRCYVYTNESLSANR